jgi:hypothetical protein
MNYREFSAFFLVACYREYLAGRQDRTAGQIIERYGLSPRPGWVRAVLDEFASRSWVEEDPTLGDELQLYVFLKGAGMRAAEEAVDEGVTVDEVPPEKFSPEVIIRSETWTGLPPSFQLTEERRAAIVRALDAAEESMPLAASSQHDKAQARAYIIAARALLEAPEPQPDLVWQLIQRANNIAGVASLFVALVALFAGH